MRYCIRLLGGADNLRSSAAARRGRRESLQTRCFPHFRTRFRAKNCCNLRVCGENEHKRTGGDPKAVVRSNQIPCNSHIPLGASAGLLSASHPAAPNRCVMASQASAPAGRSCKPPCLLQYGRGKHGGLHRARTWTASLMQTPRFAAHRAPEMQTSSFVARES